jgi:hypothetical protein
VAKRRISDDGNAMIFAPRKNPVLDCALCEIVEDLIADGADLVANGPDLFKISYIEVADASRADFAGPAKLLESSDCVLQRVLAPPVQEIAIQSVRLEAQ